MIKASFIDIIKYKLSKVKHREINAIPSCVWGISPFKDQEFVICPMESGRKALLQLFIKSYSLGNGEYQHFYRQKFFWYIS